MLSVTAQYWVDTFVGLFVLVVGALFLLALLVAIVLWVQDRFFQKSHAIRRNYPLIGRFRYFFEHLGEFFRQYFFAMDREEMPFNRAQRSWAYRAAKNIDNTAAFGSTRDLRPPGTVMFMNCPFPRLEEEIEQPAPLTFGPHCRTPYTTAHFFHISGMSFGALSIPAVRALSMGAQKAGIWLNTGEGGM